MPQLTFKQVQEYAQQHGYTLARCNPSRYSYALRIWKTDVVINCNYTTLKNVLSAITEGVMLDGESCELRPYPSGEPWDDEPTEPNPSDDEPTDPNTRSLAVSFAPPIKVVSVSAEQSTAEICIGELIKTVHLDEQGMSEDAQVTVIRKRGNETLTSKVRLVVAYYSELMVPPDEVGYHAFPLSAHGGWISWINPPKPYTVQQFNSSILHSTTTVNYDNRIRPGRVNTYY